MSAFTCGIRITCACGRCGYAACGNPQHPEYRGMDPHAAMEKHRANAHDQTEENR